jgi:hypothetical protein
MAVPLKDSMTEERLPATSEMIPCALHIPKLSAMQSEQFVNKPLCGIKAICSYLQVSRNYLYRLRGKREIPKVPSEHSVLTTTRQVLMWLESLIEGQE